MTLAELGEFGFIDRISPGCIVEPARVVQGIGDDCAVTRDLPGRLRLVTTDMLVEEIHFRREWFRPAQLGAKALAVNLSDIAAMGGQAHEAYVSLAAKPALGLEFLEGLFAGMKSLAARFRVNLLGGDTTASPGPLVINVTVIGSAAPERLLYRRGARSGDRLYVSGPLGDAAAGLALLQGGQGAASEDDRALVLRHLEPLPHLSQGQAIAASGQAHAMIDLSDGLAADLGHLCRQSGVGCRLQAEQLPRSPELQRSCADRNSDALSFALCGGEDYVLLLAGTPALPAAVGPGVWLAEIGEVTAAPELLLEAADGQRSPLPGGWDHFRSPLTDPPAP